MFRDGRILAPSLRDRGHAAPVRRLRLGAGFDDDDILARLLALNLSRKAAEVGE
jgi:hypothetical protein